MEELQNLFFFCEKSTSHAFRKQHHIFGMKNKMI